MNPGRANHGSKDTSLTQRRVLGGVGAQRWVLGSLTGAAAQTTFPQLGSPAQATR
jgi:hypothetical protein